MEEDTKLLPGVEIVAAPGHSAGTIAVAVATSDGIAVIAGDSILNALVARERRNALRGFALALSIPAGRAFAGAAWLRAGSGGKVSFNYV